MDDALRHALRPVFGGELTERQCEGTARILAASSGLTLAERAYLLATAFHETARTMQPIHERGARHYFDRYEPGTALGRALGNVRVGDGYRFRGRGYVQLTGRANYARAGRKLAVDLIAEPDRALDPDLAARILVDGMVEGWFTGRRLKDHLPGDYRGARRVVNGTDRAEKIAAHARAFEAALRPHLRDGPRSAAPPRPGRPSSLHDLLLWLKRIFGKETA